MTKSAGMLTVYPQIGHFQQTREDDKFLIQRLFPLACALQRAIAPLKSTFIRVIGWTNAVHRYVSGRWSTPFAAFQTGSARVIAHVNAVQRTLAASKLIANSKSEAQKVSAPVHPA